MAFHLEGSGKEITSDATSAWGQKRNSPKLRADVKASRTPRYSLELDSLWSSVLIIEH